MTLPSSHAEADPARPSLPWWGSVWYTLWPSLVIVLIDQISKLLVQSKIAPGEAVRILGNWVIFTNQLNPAGAMSIRLGPPIFYLLITVVVSGFLIYTLLSRPLEGLSRWALLLVLAGAVGNLIDRIRLGAVIDFVDVEFFDFSLPAINWGPIHVPGETMTRWPVFNVADAAVSVGIVLLIIATIRGDRHREAPHDSGD